VDASVHLPREVNSRTRHHQEGGVPSSIDSSWPFERPEKRARATTTSGGVLATPDETSDFGVRKGGILIAPGRRPRWHEEMLLSECLRPAPNPPRTRRPERAPGPVRH
jgi:hypothetical protein